MAAGGLPAPGSTYGPCIPDCFTEGPHNQRPLSRGGEYTKHTDCTAQEDMAAAICRFCNLAIGYDVRFYIDPDDEADKALVHADCLEDSVEPR